MKRGIFQPCASVSPPSLNRRSQIIHVVSRQGAAAVSACGDSPHVCVRVCVCVKSIMYIMQAGVLCETVCYASVCVCVCVVIPTPNQSP